MLLLIPSSPPPVGLGIAAATPAASGDGPGHQAGTTGPGPATGATTPDPAAAAPVPPPQRLLIPRIGVDAPVSAGGLNADGTVEVPPLDRPAQVDWYRGGPAPGQVGPAVLLGHLDTHKGPAVFSRLPELAPGDRIEIRRTDGSSVGYQVRELRRAPKNAFPTQLVYGDTPDPELRLITCGGSLAADGHYTDNIIVLADLVR
ncbi:class F sortase [Streptomyces tateyamensis]|uniref:class F sortase n=1 Tax=Streptomyces tateyamensis TaxID=565073 RepID=UPI0015E8BA41|nr:class F sortase [Streptomyces tateyamensis]